MKPMTRNPIVRIALALAVLLMLSWPAAAQQRPESTFARLDAKVAPHIAASETVGLFAEVAEPTTTDDAGTVEGTENAEPAPAEESAQESPDDENAISSWGARTDGQAPTRVKTVELEMQKLTTQVP